MKRLLVMLAIVFGVAVGASSSAEARPSYKKIYEELFQEELRNHRIDCNRCHTSDSVPKPLNAYGQKIADELGERNVKDKERIREALKKIGPGIVPKK